MHRQKRDRFHFLLVIDKNFQNIYFPCVFTCRPLAFPVRRNASTRLHVCSLRHVSWRRKPGETVRSNLIRAAALHWDSEECGLHSETAVREAWSQEVPPHPLSKTGGPSLERFVLPPREGEQQAGDANGHWRDANSRGRCFSCTTDSVLNSFNNTSASHELQASMCSQSTTEGNDCMVKACHLKEMPCVSCLSVTVLCAVYKLLVKHLFLFFFRWQA